MQDRDALDMVMRLMAIPGGSGQETAVMGFVREQLKEAGLPDSAFEVDTAQLRSPYKGQHGNMAVRLAGSVRAPRRLLAAHTDTVPICIGSRPVQQGDVVKSADRSTGLGADDRSGVAVLLSTLWTILREERAHPPLTFLWTVQEEVGMYGARNVRMGMLGRPKLAFNFDGGSPAKVTIGATGGYRMQLEIRGIASHAGGAPEEGVSAIAIASLAIADLVENGWHGQIIKGRKTGTSNVGVIQGGLATNVVTDHVTIRAEARSHDTKFRERIVSEIQKAFSRAARKVRNKAGKVGEIHFHGRLDYESFRLAPTQPCVVAAVEALQEEGLAPELAVANGGLDANWLTARGIPTVTLGCGQRYIHTTAEELDISEFHTARRIALRLATATK
jgi:tripeptide aminopeptidase